MDILRTQVSKARPEELAPAPGVVEGEDVVEVHAAGKAQDGGLEQKGQRRMDEGEVAVGMLAERDALAAVQQVAEVPEDGEAGVLPEDEGGGGEEES